MADPRATSRLVVVLWCIAGLLAWSAVGIKAARGGPVNWSIAAAGLFCLAMGLGAWTRVRQAGSADKQ